jgi:hypothetical protein
MVPTGGRRKATIASVQYGSEIGDHVSVGRDEPARARILRDHRFAWSGRGKIARVEISTDGGTSWSLAATGASAADLPDAMPLTVDLERERLTALTAPKAPKRAAATVVSSPISAFVVSGTASAWDADLQTPRWRPAAPAAIVFNLRKRRLRAPGIPK